MPDPFSKAERSEIMRRVKGRNTSPEIQMRAALRAVGLSGYRLHRLDLKGSPDIVFSKVKVAVFVDGCFWHGCPKCYRRPNSRRSYWDAKLRRNRERDRRNRMALRADGWCTARIWEHEVRRDPIRCARLVLSLIREGGSKTKAMRGGC